MSPPPRAGGQFDGPGLELKLVLLLHHPEMLTCPSEAQMDTSGCSSRSSAGTRR